MIKDCYFSSSAINEVYKLSTYQKGAQIAIELKVVEHKKITAIEIIIQFDQPIIAWRNHDYTWKKPDTFRIANDHSPKILVLSDHTHVVSTKNIGLWHFDPKHKDCIKWILKSTQLTPIFQYKADRSRTFLSEFTPEDYELGLLFSTLAVPEFSRSKIPFSSILCFTDHCDFDTNKKLEQQVNFFKTYGIRITKGFFLHQYASNDHFSSLEHDRSHLELVKKNGHELAYHSLTEDIREEQKAFEEFKQFHPPYEDISTWIDHGYQPYNFTKIKDKKVDFNTWGNTVAPKNIKNLWTYVDSGTASAGVINQINPEHFTVSRLIANRKNFSKSSLILLLRTSFFFAGKEATLIKYRRLAAFLKDLKKTRNLLKILPIVWILFHLISFLLSLILSSGKRTRPFKHAEYAPVIFEYKIGNHSFNMFQTVELTNFEEALCPENIDLLCREKGLLITHNYFSSTFEHQAGKFYSGERISEVNHRNFKYLGEKVKKGLIWNPTISELIHQYNQNKQIVYSLSPNGNRVIVKKVGENEPHIRYIKYT